MSSVTSTPDAGSPGHPGLHDRLMGWLLRNALASFVLNGTLRVTTAGGETFTVGDGSGKPLAVRFASRSAQLGALLDPDLKVGEAYMDGTLVVEEGTVADLLALALSQDRSARPTRWAKDAFLHECPESS
jgi:cyclopropane-fatty-acyl-phospholipid synthase